MTYELAKKLKDAGFPQNHDYFDNDIVTICIKCGDDAEKSNQVPCIPTLSELIVACGDSFGGLINTKDTGSGPVYEPYTAYNIENINFDADWYSDFFIKDGVGGRTPEEAVANLWLALRHKDISEGVDKVIEDYGETLRMLGEDDKKGKV